MVFAFHDSEELGPRMLARLAKHTGLQPEDLCRRIRVVDVLDLLAAGLSAAQVVEELPDLELADVAAALRFASRRLDHPVVAA